MFSKEAYEANPRAYWDALEREAISIQDINSKDLRGQSLFMSSVFPEIAANNSHGTCLDLGCGGGRYIPEVTPCFSKVIGIDFSMKNINAARESLASMGIGNVELYCTDLSNMENIADASASFAYSMAVFMHMPNATKFGALKELRRILKPGGIVVLVEIFPISGGAFDCPDIEEDEWIRMVWDAGLELISADEVDSFTMYKLHRRE